MRIGLLGEGTYPIVTGGVSTWADQLVTRLPDHDFSVVTLVGSDREIRWTVPSNVTSVTLVAMWDAIPKAPRFGLRGAKAEVESALLQLWSATLPGATAPDEGRGRAQSPSGLGAAEIDLTGATGALRSLSRRRVAPLAALLAQTGSAKAVLAAWQAHRATDQELPAMTLAEAAEIGRLADRMLAVMDTPWPDVDVIHVTSNGPAALMALARHWQAGTPIVLTEHGVYLRERYLALGASEMSWTVRYALTHLIRAFCEITYQESTILAPVSEFNGRWARLLGADAAKIVTVHNGANTASFTPVTSEPEAPTISFVGRIDPLKDLHTLIESFALVKAAEPEARLRLFGPTAPSAKAYRASLEELIVTRGLTASVTFEGSVPTARPAIEAGHIVALSSISEGLPFTVIEAMMCGRPTINTDVGGVSECTGTDGAAGIVVPPRDPATMAVAMLNLLADESRRRAMGVAARERALEMFSLELFERRFRGIYAAALAPHVIPLLTRNDPTAAIVAQSVASAASVASAEGLAAAMAATPAPHAPPAQPADVRRPPGLHLAERHGSERHTLERHGSERHTLERHGSERLSA